MSYALDIATILRQENALMFASFDENDAFAIGTEIRDLLSSTGRAGLIDIRLWDRQLYCCAMKGTNAENANWVRRKVNVVRRFERSSYRKALEMADAGEVFEATNGTDPKDYAAAGGGFPIRLNEQVFIGCITVSGLPQRDDHTVVVQAIAHHLGICLDGLILG